MELAAVFGAVLRERRLHAELTQEQLAFEADIQRNYVSGLELGKHQPTLAMLFTLAKALRCTPGELVTEVDTQMEKARRQKKRLPKAATKRAVKSSSRGKLEG
ncbi:helix-turn-helix domain-containing protein [Burkholderia lata]|uniref:helix-turn-helix domain-containing protein n=1 Tax=Burkholderia lata (strain ATCC 17760 / DSM 23089 / LMG 22485 / NCIMB 9086 / R18194 / 383) TaxID=482957 RepID=UPI00242E045C|nr:helix-turn-helix transcriptional regulator [Burkholderia lata]